MRAFTLESLDTQPGLRADAPEPSAGEKDLVVRVHASSVNPVDALIGMGALKEMFEYEFPVTLGRDFAGVVERVGDHVSRYRVGDELFGSPALAEDEDYLRELGVGELVDRNADVVAAVRESYPDGVDAMLDVISYGPDSSPLKEGGRLASTLGAAGEGPGRFNVMAVPSAANLQRLGELLEAETLRVPIQRSFALDQAGEALQALQSTHTKGKLGVAIAESG